MSEFGINLDKIGGVIEDVPDGHGLTDEELARRLQNAEFDDAKQTLDSKVEEISQERKDAEMNKVTTRGFQAERQRRINAEAIAFQDNAAATQMHATQMHANQRQHNTDMADIKRQLEATNKKTTEYQKQLDVARRPKTAADYDPFKYRRIYDWGIDLIPFEWDYYKKIQLKTTLEDFIKYNLRMRVPEYEIERKIRSMMKTGTSPKQKVKTKIVYKTKPASKKKSSKKKAKKPAKKKPSKKKKKSSKKKTTKKKTVKKK
jgi:hypothetical protein